MKRQRWHAAVRLPAIWLLTAITAARIETFRSTGAATASDAAALLISGTRQAVGQNLYRTADVYFHRGIRARPQVPARRDALTRLHEHISPSRHYHLEAGDVTEILPWLQATIKMDPANIEAWRVAAFWLSAPSVGKSVEAANLLLAAARLHPDDYRPLLDLARLRLHEGDIENAVRHLDRALTLWRPDPPRADRDEALLEKAELLTFSALCDEIEGRMELAAQRYDRILELFPGRDGIARRRDAIKSGDATELPALNWIMDIIAHRHAAVDDCDHHDHRQHHQHHH